MKKWDEMDYKRKHKIKTNFLMLCGILLLLTSLHYTALPSNPLYPIYASDEDNVDRMLDIIGNDVLFKQGVVDGKQAYVDGNYSIYSEAIKYCELVVKPGKQEVLKDPGFKYNIGIVHGYEEQFE